MSSIHRALLHRSLSSSVSIIIFIGISKFPNDEALHSKSSEFESNCVSIKDNDRVLRSHLQFNKGELFLFAKGLMSGTRKTATFCFGILQQLDYGLVQCQTCYFHLSLIMILEGMVFEEFVDHEIDQVHLCISLIRLVHTSCITQKNVEISNFI
uniref:Uncharacterized protein n=1 Tax=Cucumis melo TaxID=3656 RepID=A0A9I9EM76_CUCME